jgi:hypothetical protein
MSRTPTPPGCWKERYESLRRHFLEPSHRWDAMPLGLALLIREGVAAWMRRWTDSPPTPNPFHRAPLMSPVAQNAMQTQLSSLLAQMTTAHLPAIFCR